MFTLYSDRETLEVQCDNGCVSIPIITALPQWLNRLFVWADMKKPRLISYFVDYRNLMPIFPILMRWLSKKLQHKLQFENANILISSYAVAKNIDIPDGVYREIYFHQPMHYIWTLYDEYVSHMSGRKQWLYRLVTPQLRKRDSQHRNYDRILANSLSTKEQIQHLYFPQCNPHITIVHPPIEERFFYESVQIQPDNYFFYINRLTKMFKHLDKIIHLCNIHHIPLIIAGDGPDKEELLKLAGPTVTFVGRISDIETKISLMKQAKGVLNIAHESFGIVTAEALLLGVPIF